MPQPQDPKARYRPVAESTGRKLSEAPLPSSIGSPNWLCPVARVCTYMSQQSPVVFTWTETRLVASELNATFFPFAEIAGWVLSPLAGTPVARALTKRVTPESM